MSITPRLSFFRNNDLALLEIRFMGGLVSRGGSGESSYTATHHDGSVLDFYCIGANFGLCSGPVLLFCTSFVISEACVFVGGIRYFLTL